MMMMMMMILLVEKVSIFVFVCIHTITHAITQHTRLHKILATSMQCTFYANTEKCERSFAALHVTENTKKKRHKTQTSFVRLWLNDAHTDVPLFHF